MKNMFKYDLQTHTKEGSFNTTASVYDLIRILNEKGYDGLLITDHNSYKGYKFYSDNMQYLFKGISVIKGIEYDTKDEGKVIIVMPSNIYLKILTCPGLSLNQTIDIVHDYGGIIGSNDQSNPNKLDFVLKGSNNHSFRSIGTAYTLLENKINNEDEFIAYVKSKKEMIVSDNKSKKPSFLYKIYNFIQTIVYFPIRTILLKKI